MKVRKMGEIVKISQEILLCNNFFRKKEKINKKWSKKHSRWEIKIKCGTYEKTM